MYYAHNDTCMYIIINNTPGGIASVAASLGFNYKVSRELALEARKASTGKEMLNDRRSMGVRF